MTHTETLKLALEALEESKTNNDTMEFHDRKNKAITAIKEALAQPEQELVDCEKYAAIREGHRNACEEAYFCARPDLPLSTSTLTAFRHGFDRGYDVEGKQHRNEWLIQLQDEIRRLQNTTPPQRTWVGLTDVQIARVVSLAGFNPDWPEARIATQIVRTLEAELRSKNEH